MSLVHYTLCPVCNSPEINPLLTVKDHAVTGQDFVIWQCSVCVLRFTQDVPEEAAMGPYYASPDYISHSNTDKGPLNKLYQKVRRHTLQSKARLVIRYTKTKGKILDVGAGIGAFLWAMKERNWEVKGIEPDEGARKKAAELFNLLLDEPRSLQHLRGGTYDAITLWHVLEHVHQLHPYMEQLKNLLTAEGKMFIAVPNYTSGDAAAYKTYWAAYDVPRHLYHFAPASIIALVEQHGLKIIARKPMWFDSFYISLLSSNYRKDTSSWIAGGLNGLRSNLAAVFNNDKSSSIIYVIKKV